MIMVLFHLVNMFAYFINLFVGIGHIVFEFSHILLWVLGFLFFLLNAIFFYIFVQSGKFIGSSLPRKPVWFSFEIEHTWLKPNTLFLPFEFNVALCNYFLFRFSVFGYGFDFKIKWNDVVKAVIMDEESSLTSSSGLKQTHQKIKVI